MFHLRGIHTLVVEGCDHAAITVSWEGGKGSARKWGMTSEERSGLTSLSACFPLPPLALLLKHPCLAARGTEAVRGRGGAV